MIRWWISRRLAVAEARYGDSLEYLRHLLRASLAAFLQFAKLARVSRFRRALPVGPFHVARILAARHEDCGGCVQTTVAMARQDGLSPAWLQAIVDGRPDALPAELADTYDFVDRVLRATHDEGAPRERLRARYGRRTDAVLAELAVVLAATRAFPITKRVLGYANACAKVEVAP